MGNLEGSPIFLDFTSNFPRVDCFPAACQGEQRRCVRGV